ncbi:MAG: pyridoxal phosphate-dependent aminotransferase [Patescibacteria group bacterium]
MKTIIASPSFFIGKQKEKGVISFGSGQPDLPPPREVYRALKNAPVAFQYGLIQGEERLRKRLAKKYPQSSADNFVITNGGSEALDLVFRVLGRAGKSKKVLLPKPFYYSYPSIIQFAGMTPVYTKLKDGRLDAADVRKKIRGCAAILINSPSNPTGRVESVATLREIERLTKKFGVAVVSDEVYKDLIYEREYYAIKGSHVITVNSFSKTYAMCGLRVGYLYSPDAAFVQKTVEMKVHTSMNTNSLAQEMALAALAAPASYIKRQKNIWRKRRDIIYDGLQNLGFSVWKPEGAFYVFPKVNDPSRVVSDLYFKHKVIVYDGTWFGDSHRIRMSYALDEAKIREGLRRIAQYLTAHPDVL